MSNLIITPVAPALVNIVYPKAIPHLQRVVDKAPDEISIDTIKAKLLKGDAMMVVIVDGEDVIAVNILETSVFETGHKALFIPITGGDRMDEWLDRFMELAHAMARDLGCDELRGMACRKGWFRALEKHDWYQLHTVIGCKVKPLEEASQ